MKILQIGMGNVAGGLEAFVMNYYRVLVHMDIQFDFVCMYDKIAYEEEIRKLGGRIYYIPNVKKNYQGYIKELKKILKETKLKFHIFDWILKPTLSISLSSYATKIILYCLHINDSLALIIILNIIIYFIMLILFKAIRKKDLQWFADGFKKDVKKGKWETIGLYKDI